MISDKFVWVGNSLKIKFIKLEIKCSPLNEHLLLWGSKILLMGFLTAILLFEWMYP